MDRARSRPPRRTFPGRAAGSRRRRGGLAGSTPLPHRRWGPFFAAPLFADDATRREVEAINSEHAKNLKSDAFRIYQLTKARFPVAHPFSKFGTGDRKTLRPPDGAGAPPVEPLRTFYGANYVGSNMAGAVCGPQSLGELQRLSESAFARVRPGGGARSPPSAAYHLVEPAPAVDDAYVLASLSSQRAVSLQWILPYDRASPGAAAADRVDERYARHDLFLAHILGHEGPASLLADLRRRGLATQLGAGAGADPRRRRRGLVGSRRRRDTNLVAATPRRCDVDIPGGGGLDPRGPRRREYRPGSRNDPAQARTRTSSGRSTCRWS